MDIQGFAFKHSRKLGNLFRYYLELLFILQSNLSNIVYYGKKDMFRLVDVEIHSKCNRNCSYCPVHEFGHKNKKERLDEAVFKKLLNDLHSLDFRGSLVFGGFCEPLLDRRIFKFLRAARAKLGKKVNISVYTNGDYFNDSVYKFFLDYNIKAYVTLHDNSENAYLFRKKFARKKNVFIRDTIMDDYLTTMGGLVEVKKRETKKVCIHAPFILTVNSDGDIVLCCEDFFAKNKFGNIAENKIVDIWNDENFVRLRKKLKSGHSEIPLCRFCLDSPKN